MRPCPISTSTHAFLWFVEGKEALSPASYWEICVKLSIGKLVLADGWPRLFEREIRRNGIHWLDLKPEHFRGIIDLPFLHRNPPLWREDGLVGRRLHPPGAGP